MLRHQDDSSLLKAYIQEWMKFFTQCNYLPKPFGTLESNLHGKAGGGTSKRPSTDGITVQKVTLSAVCMLLVYISVTLRFCKMRFFMLPDVTHESMESCPNGA